MLAKHNVSLEVAHNVELGLHKRLCKERGMSIQMKAIEEDNQHPNVPSINLITRINLLGMTQRPPI